MTRLFHAGAETGHEHAEGLTVEGSGTFSFTTSTPRTGSRAYQFDSGGSNLTIGAYYPNAGLATSRNYYAQAYFRCVSSLPSSTTSLLRWNAGTTTLCSAALTSGGKIRLLNQAGTQIGSDSSATVVADTWYRLALRVRIVAGASDQAEAMLDGVSVASTSSGSFSDSAPSRAYIGWLATAPGASKQIRFDDFVVNDDQGTNHNSWPMAEAVALLVPTSDNARTGWTAGAGGTTNLYDALNNTPPVGVDNASGTNTSQIKDGNNNSTDTYSANMTDYLTAGIGSADQITAVYALIEGGNSSTTGSDTLGVQVTSNPAISEATPSIDADDNTYPTGWLRGATSIVENPVVAKGTAPVMRVRKGVATTRVAGCCFMGMYVSYLPEKITAAAGDTFINETFTGTSNTELHSYSANWTDLLAILAPGTFDTLRISNANRVRSQATGSVHQAQYYHSASPTSDEYDLRADLRVITNEASGGAGVITHTDTSTGAGYIFQYAQSTGLWSLADPSTTLATASQSLSTSTTYAIELRVRDTGIACYVDGQQVMYAPYTQALAAGNVSITIASTLGDDTHGYHLDSLIAQDVVTTPGGGGGTRYRAIIG